ncbi:MAG: hypothetical protein AAF827_07045 [Cyanobacteria bacterium P01_D01_bin.6]
MRNKPADCGGMLDMAPVLTSLPLAILEFYALKLWGGTLQAGLACENG